MSIWTTKYGCVLCVEEMTDEHLINTMKMLVRNEFVDYVAQELDHEHQRFNRV